MTSWATQRKTLWAGLVVLAGVLFVGVPLFYYLYHPATCTDGIKNSNELDIDCGGSCSRLCQSAFLPAIVSWTKLENVVPGLYNVSAYIVNPNTGGTAVNAPYRFSLYDSKGVLITEVEGATILPPHRNTLAFQSAVNVAQRIPSRVVFEFIEPPLWRKSHDTLENLTISDKKYNEDENGSSLEVTLGNRSLYAYHDVYAFAILYDLKGNTIGFSRTHIDSIEPGTTEIAPFTWPTNRHGLVATIEILPVISPPLD